LVAVGKVDEQVGNVAGDVEVGPPEMFRETLLGQGAEQLTERMPWRNLRSHMHLSHILKTPELIIADDDRYRPHDLSIGLHETDLSIGRN
jgi:hypothetical protein